STRPGCRSSAGSTWTPGHSPRSSIRFSVSSTRTKRKPSEALRHPRLRAHRGCRRSRSPGRRPQHPARPGLLRTLGLVRKVLPHRPSVTWWPRPKGFIAALDIEVFGIPASVGANHRYASATQDVLDESKESAPDASSSESGINVEGIKIVAATDRG